MLIILSQSISCVTNEQKFNGWKRSFRQQHDKLHECYYVAADNGGHVSIDRVSNVYISPAKGKKIKDHNLKEETFKENTISLISHKKKT